MTPDSITPGALAPTLAADAGLYCTGEEALRLTSFNADADAAVTLAGRFLELGRIHPSPLQVRHVPNTDRTAATVDIPLGEGWLQGVTVLASAGSPPYAQTYVRVDLVRGTGTSATVLQTLLAGPVTALTRQAWPGSPLKASIEGPGALRSITGTDPAAGAEVSETVPTGARWRLLALAVTLVTDATVANREIVVTLDDGASVYLATARGVNQTASTTIRHSVADFGVVGSLATANEAKMVLPVLVLPAGHRIRTLTSNLQAGDNYGAPQLFVEEWLEAQ